MTKQLQFEVLPKTPEGSTGIQVHPAKMQAIVSKEDGTRAGPAPIDARAVWMNDRVIPILLAPKRCPVFAKALHELRRAVPV